MYSPIELSEITEKIVVKNNFKKYYRFRPTGFYGGIATADTVGCNLRCKFCWSSNSVWNAKNAGKFYSSEEVADILQSIAEKKDYHQLRVSGGEPTIHMDYVHQLLKELKKDNIHICLETCGYYNRETFNELILPYINLVYYDLKIFDSNLHKKYCGVSNDVIFRNFEDLINKKGNIEILPRIPLIPKITATNENLEKLKKYLLSFHIVKIGLLPYNPLWLSKTETIGVKAEYNRSNWLGKEEKEEIKKIFSNFEFKDF